MSNLNNLRNRLENLIESNIKLIEKNSIGGFYKICYKSNKEKMEKLIKYIQSFNDKDNKMNLKKFYEYLNKDKIKNNNTNRHIIDTNATIIIYKKIDRVNNKNKRSFRYRINGIFYKFIQIRYMNVSVNNSINKFLNKRIFNHHQEFNELIDILSYDPVFNEFYENIKDYCDCISIIKTEEILQEEPNYNIE